MAPFFNTITQRHAAYPAIDPLLPQHSTRGKTVLITAGATGVGKSVSRAFALSGARRIFVALRNPDLHRQACKQLQNEFPGVFEVVQVSLDSRESIETLWQRTLTEEKIDIVVLSAAHSPHRGPSTTIPFHDATVAMTTNIVGNWEMARHYLASCTSFRGTVVDISSGFAHASNGRSSVYGASKIGCSFLLAALASENRAQMRLFSLHPGVVWSTMADRAGYKRSDLPVDEDDLVGSFVVWLVSGEEKPWLEGRFVWASWDVDKLASCKDALLADETLLTLGLLGWAGPTA